MLSLETVRGSDFPLRYNILLVMLRLTKIKKNIQKNKESVIGCNDEVKKTKETR